jgi:hypothetical protein
MTRRTHPLSYYMAQGHVWPSGSTLGVPDPFDVVWMKYVVDGHGSYYKLSKYSQYEVFNISLSGTYMINQNQWRAYNSSVVDQNL